MTLDADIGDIHGRLRQVSLCSAHRSKWFDLYSQLLLPEKHSCCCQL